VQSCLDKLKGGEMARLFELLEVRFAFFGTETERLRTLVANLSADLALLQDIERNNRSRVEQVAEEIEPQLNAHFTRALDAVEQVIDAYMSSGSPESARISGETARKGVFDFLSGFLPRLSRRERLKKANAAYAEYEAVTGRSSAIGSAPDLSDHMRGRSRERIEVDTAEEARAKSRAIYDAFQAELEQSATDLLTWTKVALEEVSTDAKDGVDSSFREGWSSVQEHISEVINVTISPPDIEVNLGNKAVFDELARQRGYATRTSSYTVTSDRGGVGAAVQRFFGGILGESSWGRETTTKSSTNHYIEIGPIRDEIKKQSTELKDELFATVQAYVKALDISLGAYADEVKNKVEQIHRFIYEERNQREGDAELYALLREQVSALAAQANDLKQEAMALRIGVR
jgi:gas vesicle protein